MPIPDVGQFGRNPNADDAMLQHFSGRAGSADPNATLASVVPETANARFCLGLSDACRSVRVATSVIARHPTLLNRSGKFLSSSSCVFRAAPGIISPPNAKLTSNAGRLLGRALILPNYNARWYAEKNSSAE